jgi:O-glycosyl hydrolase
MSLQLRSSDTPRVALEPLETRRLLAAALPEVGVVVDADAPRHEIDGFGAAAWILPHESYKRPQIFNEMPGDVGTTMVRLHIPAGFEQANDDRDPYFAAPGEFDSEYLEMTLPHVQELEKRQDMFVLATYWSAPYWMKTNTDTQVGGILRPEMREEFAENLVEFVRASDRDFGVKIDAVSLQNESLFVELYESSYYTPAQLAKLLRVVDDRLNFEGMDTQIVFGDDLNANGRMKMWADAVVDEFGIDNIPERLVMGTHWSPSRYAHVMGETAERLDRPVWSTEAGGKGNASLGAGMVMLEEMQIYLDNGVSAYMEWQAVGRPDSSLYYEDGPDDELVKTGRYAAMKHVARWMRPGSHVVDTDVQNFVSGFNALAATDADNGTRTLVLSHLGDEDLAVTFDFADVFPDGARGGDWSSWLTLESDGTNSDAWVRRADAGGTGELPLTVSADGATVSFTMPARSMVTLTDWTGDPTGATTANSAQPGRYKSGEQPLHSLNDITYGAVRGWGQGTIDAVNADTSGDMMRQVDPGTQRNALFAASGSGIKQMITASMAVYDRAADLGMDFNVQDVVGMTPLMTAAASSAYGLWYVSLPDWFLVPSEWNQQRMQTIVGYGGDLHTRDDLGRTALAWSAISARVQVVDGAATYPSDNTPYLLAMGADANKVDLTDRTALDWAIDEGNVGAAVALQDWLSDPTNDVVAPELLRVTDEDEAFLGATLDFDEKLGNVSADDFVLVRDDGTEHAIDRIELETLPGGNTRVHVAAEGEGTTRGLPEAGVWRVYPRSGGAADVAGNAYVAVPDSRGRNAVRFAEVVWLPGDANGDGRVGLDDFGSMRQNFGDRNASRAQGDFNFDGRVDLRDFQAIRRGFGNTLDSLRAAATGDFGGRGDAVASPPASLAVDATPASDLPGATATARGDRVSLFSDEAESPFFAGRAG